MRFAAFVLLIIGLLALSPTVRPGGTQEVRTCIGAYYYPWYFQERWTKEPVTDTPQLGWYKSDERFVARRHVQWAQQAGLNFFMASWLAPQGREDRNLKQAVLPELEEGHFPFGILYETPLALNLPAGKTIDLDQKLPDGVRAGDRLIEHFDYLADHYLKNRCYLTFEGKAVVEIYLVRDMVNAGSYLKRVRGRLKQRGIELYLIADAIYWEPAEKVDWNFLKENFQAVTAYNLYYRPKFLASVGEQFAASDRLARNHGLRFIPNVMPGYDDTPLRGEERVTINRRRGQFYRENWEVATPFVKPDQPFLLITSFNEWHEGTEIEPSAEYGDKYIHLTRELISQASRRRSH